MSVCRRPQWRSGWAGWKATVSCPRTAPRSTRERSATRELKKVADLARRTPEVVECHRITGEDCYFMKAHVRDVTHMEEVIDVFAAYGQTTTSIVQSSPVPARGVTAGL